MLPQHYTHDVTKFQNSGDGNHESYSICCVDKVASIQPLHDAPYLLDAVQESLSGGHDHSTKIAVSPLF